MVENRIFKCEVKADSMRDTDNFALRLYKLSAWLNRRYQLESKNIDFTYHFEDEQYKRGFVTIRLVFR